MDEQLMRSKRATDSDNEDRISNLPDGILPYILSFVSTKDAVKTSVVSKKWNSLWTSVPTLDLSDTYFSCNRGKQDFLAFVDRFFKQNLLPLRTFRLSCSECYTLSHINEWVSVAEERNVQELHLEAYVYEKPFPNSSQERSRMSVGLLRSDGNLMSRLKCSRSSVLEYWISYIKEQKIKELGLELDLSTSIFKEIHKWPRTSMTLDTLQVLKLQGRMVNCFALLSFCFPNLKVLHLTNVKFGDNTLASIFTKNCCPITASIFINCSCPLLEELELDLVLSPFKDTPKVPQNFCRFEKLQVLKLRGKMVLSFRTASVCFVNLKVLHLWKIKFEDDESASNFINYSCPVLKELEIYRSDSDNIVNLIISSQTLECLKVHFTNAVVDLEFKTLINAPNLCFMELRDTLTSEYIMGDLDRLVEARLDVWKSCKSQSYNETGYASCLFILLRKIHNVKRLSLSEYTMLALQKADCYDLPMFLNLTCLEILDRACGESISWKLMLVFLKSCPNIKDLIMQGTSSNLGEESDMRIEQDLPQTVNQLSQAQSPMVWLTKFWAGL